MNEDEQAHAVPGSEGTRISTFDEDVATAVVSDGLANVGNASRVEAVELLNQIRKLSMVTIVVGLLLLLAGGGLFLYMQDIRSEVKEAKEATTWTQEVLCSVAADFERTLEVDITIPEECP